MNRSTFNGMLGQYAVQELTGEGHVSWENGAHCVIPKVEIRGKAVQDGTPSPDNPIDPVFSEGTEVKACGSNLVDIPDLATTGYYVWMGKYLQWYIDLPLGTTYTISMDRFTGSGDADFWVVKLKDNTSIYLTDSYRYASKPKRISSTLTKTVHFTMDEVSLSLLYFGTRDGNEHYSKNITVNIGEKDLGYEPYFDGGTATCPETLLAIPDTEYYDTWNPQTGEGIRRCAAIESYAGETIDTPYISSTGELSEGAYVIYGIPDTPFATDPQPLIQPPGAGNIIQTAGTVDTPITVKCVTHS